MIRKRMKACLTTFWRMLNQHELEAWLARQRGAGGPRLETSWKHIPWAERVLLLVGAPLFGLWMYLTTNRERIGRKLNTDDLESRDDIEQAEASPELTEAVMSSRDEHLGQEISAILDEGNEYKRIGILYGAAHMRAIVRRLDEKYGYKVAEAEWIKVFDYGER